MLCGAAVQPFFVRLPQSAQISNREASVGMSGLRELEQPTLAGRPSVSNRDSTWGRGQNSNLRYSSKCRTMLSSQIC